MRTCSLDIRGWPIAYLRQHVERCLDSSCCTDRLQILGAIGTVDAQQATIEATLRLKDLSEEEACAQAGIVIDLLLNLWEPLQAVRML